MQPTLARADDACEDDPALTRARGQAARSRIHRSSVSRALRPLARRSSLRRPAARSLPFPRAVCFALRFAAASVCAAWLAQRNIEQSQHAREQTVYTGRRCARRSAYLLRAEATFMCRAAPACVSERCVERSRLGSRSAQSRYSLDSAEQRCSCAPLNSFSMPMSTSGGGEALRHPRCELCKYGDLAVHQNCGAAVSSPVLRFLRSCAPLSPRLLLLNLPVLRWFGCACVCASAAASRARQRARVKRRMLRSRSQQRRPTEKRYLGNLNFFAGFAFSSFSVLFFSLSPRAPSDIPSLLRPKPIEHASAHTGAAMSRGRHRASNGSTHSRSAATAAAAAFLATNRDREIEAKQKAHVKLAVKCCKTTAEYSKRPIAAECTREFRFMCGYIFCCCCDLDSWCGFFFIS